MTFENIGVKNTGTFIHMVHEGVTQKATCGALFLGKLL